VKRLHPLHAADELAVARVAKQARLAGRLQHPNVVAVLGLVRRPGELLAVLEYVPGLSLAELHAASPEGVAPRVAAAIAAGALRGAQAAHDLRGLGPRRDLSPRRVLVGEDGVARTSVLETPVPSVAASVAAKLPYAAPEQLLGRRIDPRRDVYAIAVLLWETLTGRPLFHGPSLTDTLDRVLRALVLPPSTFARAVPAELDAIVLRGLARDPADRFPSARAMAAELERGAASPDEVAQAARTRTPRGRTLHTECNARSLKE
jgi:eukaryotic-like serine/threonine-protein kinase